MFSARWWRRRPWSGRGSTSLRARSLFSRPWSTRSSPRASRPRSGSRVSVRPSSLRDLRLRQDKRGRLVLFASGNVAAQRGVKRRGPGDRSRARSRRRACRPALRHECRAIVLGGGGTCYLEKRATKKKRRPRSCFFLRSASRSLVKTASSSAEGTWNSAAFE